MWNTRPAASHAGLALGLALAIVVATACSSSGGASNADPSSPFGGGGGGDAPSATDGIKNGDETDVDCGGTTTGAPKCTDGKGCKISADCQSSVCKGGTCEVPSGTDGIKNGDETDVDCGGTTTGAPKCEAGKACAANADCASEGCAYDKKCAEAPSCVAHFGGDTCGTGEIGDGAEKHESCCRSLQVPSFQDPSEPGKIVYLDKYEVTAGRVRAFLAALTEAYGKPDVKRWINENKPNGWKDAYSEWLPSDTDAEDTAQGNVGTNYAFGAKLYVYVHGHNCFQGTGSYGYPTYWYPPDVMKTQNGGLPRVATQEQLDAKAMTCIPNAVLAAFCAWDGGQLATAEVLESVTAKGSRLPPLDTRVVNVSTDSGGTSRAYYYPSFADDVTHEGVSRIAAPGRVAADSTRISGGEPWMDLRGNLNEVARSSDGRFALLYQGIGYSSARAQGNPSVIPLAYYKAAYSGGRCMRFR